MSIRQNDLCPCGSGKKYKHCCLRQDQNPVVDQKAHDGAVEKAIEWLSARHRKGLSAAYALLCAELLAEEDIDKLHDLDEETLVSVQLNLTEWMLAEGEILVQGVTRRVPDYVLGPSGPSLTIGQRDWLQQLAQRPLRLYDVTDVVPGVQMTLCDALDGDAAPVVVLERSGTRSIEPGLQLGCRVMRVAEHFELSGAAYPFSMLAGQAVANRLRDTAKEFGHLPDLASEQGLVLASAWLQQFVAPPPMPMMMDAYSGEPMLLITDHYLVLDWPGLASALGGCADVFGDRQDGWDRRIDCADGQTRSLAAINLGEKKNSIEIFYKTQTYADQGRAWFEALTGALVAFQKREISDLKDLMGKGNKSAASPAKSASMPDIDPQTMTQVMEEFLRRTYAHWADESIPALSNKTPRQAIQTAAGLERVKGLLRSYEASEKAQAAQQNRAEVSYDFLWQALGLSR